MRATGPAAGAAFTFEQFLAAAHNPASARLGQLGAFYPADKLVASQWGNVLPERFGFGVGK
jgi:hypothetical protein